MTLQRFFVFCIFSILGVLCLPGLCRGASFTNTPACPPSRWGVCCLWTCYSCVVRSLFIEPLSCREVLGALGVDWSSPLGASCCSAMLWCMAGKKPAKKSLSKREKLAVEDGYREAWDEFMPRVLEQDRKMMARIDELLDKPDKQNHEIRELNILLNHRKVGVDRKYGTPRARTETTTTHSVVTQDVAALVAGSRPDLPLGLPSGSSASDSSVDDFSSDVIDGEVLGSSIEEFDDHE